MRTLTIILLICVAYVFPAHAKGNKIAQPFGIVTGEKTVGLQLTRKKMSVRALRKLQPGDICNLLPGDLVLFVDEDKTTVTVRRLGPSELSFTMLKGVINIGRSKACPLNAVGKVPKEYYLIWLHAHDSSTK